MKYLMLVINIESLKQPLALSYEINDYDRISGHYLFFFSKWDMVR